MILLGWGRAFHRIHHGKQAEDPKLEKLKTAVQSFARTNANSDGLAVTDIPGLMMKFVEAPTGDLHALYSPMVCLILQGAKHVTIGSHSAMIRAGETFILSNSIPTKGTIVEATRRDPYVAIAVKIDPRVLAELSADFDVKQRSRIGSGPQCLFTDNASGFLMDCLSKLVRLLDHPEAAAVLHANIMRELHYWLLSGEHGPDLRSLVNVSSRAGRLESAIALLRAEYSDRLPAKRLADAAGMSLTSFHKHFKQLTAMTPGQYQKQIRLMEARRLMHDEGVSATGAAFRVGYESASQFSRDYTRMFDRPPKQDALAARGRSQGIVGNRPAAE
jgi:AraC-like DNA-binding protein